MTLIPVATIDILFPTSLAVVIGILIIFRVVKTIINLVV